MIATKTPVTEEELARHKTREDIWIAVHGSVYDVTDFIEEHPGGPEVLLEQAGMDASVAFDDIGHSDHARDLLKNFLVAPLAIPRVPSGEGKSNPGRVSSPENHFNPWNSKWVPITIVSAVIAGLLVYHYSGR